MKILVVNSFFLFVCLFAAPHESHHTTGTATADSYTFDKLLETFDVILAKFDDLFPLGDKHDHFRNLADRIGATKNFLLVEILLVENDINQNGLLGKEFGVRKENYPVYRLFLNGSRQAINYDGDKTNEDVQRFLLEHADLRFSLLGTVDELNPIALEFYRSSINQSLSDMNSLLEETRNLVDNFNFAKDKRRGDIYIKFMEMILSKGSQSIPDEQRRIKNILASKITNDKKYQLEERFNILLAFNPIKQKNRFPVGPQFINLDEI